MKRKSIKSKSTKEKSDISAHRNLSGVSHKTQFYELTATSGGYWEDLTLNKRAHHNSHNFCQILLLELISVTSNYNVMTMTISHTLTITILLV